MAINKAQQMINNGVMLDIPKNIQQQNEGYLYPHDFGGYVDQEYLTQKLELVEFKEIGFEAKMKSWIEKLKL